MASRSDEEGEIILYGDVMSRQPTDWWTGEPEPGLFITPEGFMEDLEQVKDKDRITVRLNSCGGDLYTGIAIHNALSSLSGTVNVIVEGIAASAASVIMCAADTISVHPGSLIMIHGVTVWLRDGFNITEIEGVTKYMDACERAVAEIYSSKTGIDVGELRSMMAAETWMTGREAIGAGFADELLDGAVDINMSADKKIMVINGVQHSSEGWKNVPWDKISSSLAKIGLLAPPKTIMQIEGREGGNKNMTLEEFKQKYPEAKAEVEQQVRQAWAEGVAKERTRLQEIDSIQAAIADQELLAEAKFGDTACTAEQLSFRAMQKHAQMGTTFLAAREQEIKQSGSGGVKNLPPADDGREKDSTTPEDLAAVVNAYKNTKGEPR